MNCFLNLTYFESPGYQSSKSMPVRVRAGVGPKSMTVRSDLKIVEDKNVSDSESFYLIFFNFNNTNEMVRTISPDRKRLYKQNSSQIHGFGKSLYFMNLEFSIFRMFIGINRL